VSELPTLEERMEDLRAVMEAVGSEKAALFGFSEGGNLSALFAATYPERTRALVMFGVFAKRVWSPDYPWAPTPEARAKEYELVEREWGNEVGLEQYIPAQFNDTDLVRRLATYFRRAASPMAAVSLLRMNTDIDIRSILPTIQVPTLIIHREHDLQALLDEGRWIASQIPGARLIELKGQEHIPWIGNQDEVLDHIQEFLTGVKPTQDFDRVLSTLLFTDIVGSTELAAEIGDHAWRELLERHDSIIRQKILEYKGEEIDTTGDGFLIAFSGPVRAVRCALAIIAAVVKENIDIRAGLHTGEVHKVASKVSGLSVHIAERVMRKAGAGEVMITKAVKNLVSGSGFVLEDKGTEALKGVPGEWQLYGVK
jgi:class 3 adenylate cyclase